MDRLALDAPAKINLVLEVLGRRPDRYHEIDTVMQTVTLADRITLERADTLEIEVEGDAPADSTNLAWRAAEALNQNVRIRIEKEIPAGAGLGGGSSDAAAVLLGLDRMFDLGLGPKGLQGPAARLGADVPFFLHGGTARCRGIGDRVEMVENPPAGRFLLVMPGVLAATESVYRALPAGLTGNPELATVFINEYCASDGGDRVVWFNRLQEAAEALEPRLVSVRKGAESQFGRAFLMTGSGAAYFAAWDQADEPRGDIDLGGVPAKVLVVKSRGRTSVAG